MSEPRAVPTLTELDADRAREVAMLTHDTEASPGPTRHSPLHPDSPLSPQGQAWAIAQIVQTTAEGHVGFARAARIAADVFEAIEVRP